jgi:hypothetical protein
VVEHRTLESAKILLDFGKDLASLSFSGQGRVASHLLFKD